jgi:polyhydroxyalkanoate synthesis regulator phasin
MSNENRRQILEMLAQGKISADEAERLIAAVEKSAGVATTDEPEAKRKAKYLRVVVESDDVHSQGTTKVNIRVPMQLLRAGVKLASLIPDQAREHVNEALHEQGIKVDLTQIKPENLEDLIDHLNDLTVDVDEKSNKVRIFCE